jgi:hypothetical protein
MVLLTINRIQVNEALQNICKNLFIKISTFMLKTCCPQLQNFLIFQDISAEYWNLKMALLSPELRMDFGHEILVNLKANHGNVCVFEQLKTRNFDIYIYSAILKRLATPSDFHIPLLWIVPFTHSETSFTHGCIYPTFPCSSGTTWFFPSFRFPGDRNFWPSHWVHYLNASTPN